MDIQKERELFENWWVEFNNGRQISCDYVSEDNSYSVGYANAQWVAWQAAKASATTAWVSVDDRLPDFEQEVLLISGSERLIGQYLPSAVNEFGIHFDEGFWINEGATIVNATHWQLLPKLSKVQEQSQ